MLESVFLLAENIFTFPGQVSYVYIAKACPLGYLLSQSGLSNPRSSYSREGGYLAVWLDPEPLNSLLPYFKDEVIYPQRTVGRSDQDDIATKMASFALCANPLINLWL